MSYNIDKVITIAKSKKPLKLKHFDNTLNSESQYFINSCFREAYGETIAKRILCVPSIWYYNLNICSSYFKSKNRWYRKPHIGDIVYFNKGGNLSYCGLVYKVAGDVFNTIESIGGEILDKMYLLSSNSNIAGFGRPAYETRMDITPDETPIRNIVASAALNIRENADMHSKAVGEYLKDEPINILSVENEEWYCTDRGYVRGCYVDSASRTCIEETPILKFPNSYATYINSYPIGTKIPILSEKNDYYLTPKGWCLKCHMV